MARRPRTAGNSPSTSPRIPSRSGRPSVIDPHWQVIDLDPVTWRNLGHFFEPWQYIAAAQPGERGLFVLHDHGRLLRVVDTESESPPEGIPARIADPRALARELYGRGEWQRVHVIDRRHLAWVAQQVQ